MKTPNSKLQTPDKHQTPNTNANTKNARAFGLMFGVWIFSGSWILDPGSALAAEPRPLYQNDFSKVEIGKLPEEMLLLDGGFAVQDVSGNKVLQLPGAPLDTFGVLFG